MKVKALRVSDFPEEAWIIYGDTAGGKDKELLDLYSAVAIMYRATTIRAQKLAAVPFVIKRGEKVLFDSEDEEAPPPGFEWFLDLPGLLERIEVSCVLGGRAYLRPLSNQAGILRELRWITSPTITPEWDQQTGELLRFVRRANNSVENLKPEDLIHLWPPDHTVETGPAKHYPGRAAMEAAGVLCNMDEFLAHYFERGAVKVTLLTAEGIVRPDERERLKEWWSRVISGIKNAFGMEVINAGKVTPVVIGEGVKDLENTSLTLEKREDILIAMGVPPSKVLPNAANFATKQSDDVMLVTDTVAPQLRWIERQLNRQLFGPMDLHISFRPEQLSEMQVDENERSLSLVNLTSAGLPLLVACDILGVDIPPEQRDALEQLDQLKREAAEVSTQRLIDGATQPPGFPNQPPGFKEEEEEEEEKTPPAKAWRLLRQLEEANRLERWLRKDPTRDPADFKSDWLDDRTKAQVKAITDGRFISQEQPEPAPTPSIMALSDPDDLDRLIEDVEKWAKSAGMDLDKFLKAQRDEYAPKE